jgi:hypothetical protein
MAVSFRAGSHCHEHDSSGSDGLLPEEGVERFGAGRFDSGALATIVVK